MGSQSSWCRVRVERGIYLLPNGKHAVCARRAGKLWSRTVSGDLAAARVAREALVVSIEAVLEPLSPRLRFDTVASRWLQRFEMRVAAGERRARTLEAHRYYVDRHLLPVFAARRVSSITVDDIAAFLAETRSSGASAKTAANALATLQSIMRDERPRPGRRQQRVLGRAEIGRLLYASSPCDRPIIATALFTGLRISELLGLVWGDIDMTGGVISVRAQLSRAHRGEPARRVQPKTPASIRQVPLVAQLARILAEHRLASPSGRDDDWVFTTSRGTPHGHRNIARRGLGWAADAAGLNTGEWPPLRFHDLRHTFASHLILDLGVDVAQVSRILGHASVTITLDVYTHLFDDARHRREIRARMRASVFAGLLEDGDASRRSCAERHGSISPSVGSPHSVSAHGSQSRSAWNRSRQGAPVAGSPNGIAKASRARQGSTA
jgi:integrase